jgi:hypothetical protein
MFLTMDQLTRKLDLLPEKARKLTKSEPSRNPFAVDRLGYFQNFFWFQNGVSLVLNIESCECPPGSPRRHPSGFFAPTFGNQQSQYTGRVTNLDIVNVFWVSNSRVVTLKVNRCQHDRLLSWQGEEEGVPVISFIGRLDSRSQRRFTVKNFASRQFSEPIEMPLDNIDLP